jgi:hypothetical protein
VTASAAVRNSVACCSSSHAVSHTTAQAPFGPS